MTKVFVYGTLREGEGNHGFLGSAEKLADAVLPHKGVYSLIDFGPFPAVIIDSENPVDVVGELYEVDDVQFQALDMLEGHPDFYHRGQLEVETNEGSHTAWVYIHPPVEGPTYIENGDWVNR